MHENEQLFWQLWLVMRGFFLLFLSLGWLMYPNPAETHTHRHTREIQRLQVTLAGICYGGAVSDRAAAHLPLGRADAGCRRLNPKGFARPISPLKYEASGTRSASQADSLQLANQPKLLNRKVIITREAGTRSVLVYNEGLSGEASRTLDPSGSESYRKHPIEFNANFMQSRLCAFVKWVCVRETDLEGEALCVWPAPTL